MLDTTSIRGKVLMERSVIKRLIAETQPSKLGKDSGLYDIGYENAKSTIRSVLQEALGEAGKDPFTELLKELR